MRIAPSIPWIAALLCFPALPSPAATATVLMSERTHLRSGSVPEWTEFASSTPAGQSWERSFRASSNATEWTLFIRQDEVRQDWVVELNRKRLGKLFLMEADLVQTLAVPPGALRDGDNLLSILPPRDNDDIVLHAIHLDPRPPTNAVREAILRVDVREGGSTRGLPCRITLVNAQGALAPVMNAGPDPVAVRPGVVYSGTGRARLGLPAGDYTIYASRGLEWSVATQRVHLASDGLAGVELALTRVVPTPGWVSCDPHVHTFTHSRHGDATLDERLITLAGEGIELPVATDHNLHVDYSEAARRTGLAGWFTPIVGNEVTTSAGHFNIFPVDPAARIPNPLITDWPRLMASLRATPDVRVVVLNHPRNVHNQFQPFAATNFNAVTGENLRGPPFTFDAMEVLSSSAQQSDYLRVYQDWFALLNHGHRITALGSSDGHDVSRYIIGQGRTYVAAPDAAPGGIDVAGACSNLLAGRALVSMGLFVNMRVNDRFDVGALATELGPRIQVTVQVGAPAWIQATNVGLFANGLLMHEQPLTGATPGGTIEWTLPRPPHDVHLVAIATGPCVSAPFWAIPRPYQPTSPHWEGRVIGSTNPIWVDGDGDGTFTPARAYAQKLVAAAGGDAARLIASLNGYDQAVAAQAASLSAASGQPLDAPPLAGARAAVSEAVRRGIDSFAAARR